MANQASQTPQNDELETEESKKTVSIERDEEEDRQSREGTELYDSPTPDSYDSHIIPAETAARKEREDGSYKHLDKYPPGSESINTTGGFTVDKEGLVDNFGVEPEMYYETPGDLLEEEDSEPEQELEQRDR